MPVVTAAIVLFLLHRRVKRKHAQEDRDDKYKSLDFGLDAVPSRGRGGKGVPEMSVTEMEKSTRDIMRSRGISLDMTTPYLLPSAVSGSNSSLHSMSRSMQDGADPYRPVTMVRTDSESMRSSSHPKAGNASVYTDMSERSNDNLNAGLLSNAQRMSRSDPFMAESPDSLNAPTYPTPPVPVHTTNSYAASAAPRAKPAPPQLSMPSPVAFHDTPPSPPTHDGPPEKRSKANSAPSSFSSAKSAIDSGDCTAQFQGSTTPNDWQPVRQSKA